MTILAGILFLLAAVAQSQTAAPQPKVTSATELYRELRATGLDGTRVFHVRDGSIDREDLHLSLEEGLLIFTTPVEGHTTGAFFIGDGEVLLVPPDQAERSSLSLFTGAAVLEERFTSAYLRFFDDKLLQDLAPALRPPSDDDDVQQALTRWNASVKMLSEPDALRLLVSFFNETKESDSASGRQYLHARLSGVKHSLFDVTFDAALDEQISAGQVTYGKLGGFYDVWCSFPMRSRRNSETHLVRKVVATDFNIRAHVIPPETIEGEAEVTLHANAPTARAIAFELSRQLKVSKVMEGGRELEFLQNESLAGGEIARKGNDLVTVILPAGMQPGSMLRLAFTYSGQVLSDAGGGLLYVGARGTWYPNLGLSMANYQLDFRTPSAWTLVATGKLASSEQVQGEQHTRWVSERPIPVAGFNLGHYEVSRAEAANASVEAYATTSVENALRAPPTVVAVPRPQPGRVFAPPPTPAAPTARPSPASHASKVAEISAKTVNFISKNVSPFPYSTLKLTQLPGPLSQGWPGLVFLSTYAFVPDSRPPSANPEYSRIHYNSLMISHETAHQWWGDAIYWSTYRDQWLSEALANYCALMTIEEESPQDVRTVLEFYRKNLLSEQSGHRNFEAGPVTFGFRLESSAFPEGYFVTYTRGTWLIHMLRTMFKEAAPNGDELFFGVLRKLQRDYGGKQMSTADVQQAFEAALPRSLYYDGKPSLSWFFDGWVNGTAMPKYELQDVRISAKGAAMVATGDLLQQEAPKELITAVPIYAELQNGAKRFVGRVFADGPESSLRLTVPEGTRRLLVDPEQTLLTRP